MCFYKHVSFNFLIGPNGSQDLPAMLGMFPPSFTSTPHRAAPPPPPPLPPPCPITSSTETLTVSELIRKRRKEKDPEMVMGRDSVLKRGPDVKGMPSMLVVLKDLNQVKLRSVERYYQSHDNINILKYYSFCNCLLVCALYYISALTFYFLELCS